MKLERMIGIITELQINKKTTAIKLAEKFEVSRRTILRDIDSLCLAGIPIITAQGGDGGISIMDGFNIDTTVFSKDELEAIFVGLKGIESVSNNNISKSLKTKFSNNTDLADNIIIDLSSYYKDSLSTKIELIKDSIDKSKLIKFDYYYEKGDSKKEIEPYLIVFMWSSWYVFGFCTDRQDFRMYKLQRLWNLIQSENSFVKREIPEDKKKFGFNIKDDYLIEAIFEASEKYKIIEAYSPDSVKTLEN